MADHLTDEDAAKPWVSEAVSDPRAGKQALQKVIEARFGDRAVIAVPGDPLANAQAAANGCQVIHGGSLPGGAWANIRKNELLVTTSAAFPQKKPVALPPEPGVCPLCGK